MKFDAQKFVQIISKVYICQTNKQKKRIMECSQDVILCGVECEVHYIFEEGYESRGYDDGCPDYFEITKLYLDGGTTDAIGFLFQYPEMEEHLKSKIIENHYKWY